MKLNLSLFVVSLAVIFTSCVPARKFEEMEAKHVKCDYELQVSHEKMQALEAYKNENSRRIEDFDKRHKSLVRDTSILSKSLRLKEKQYDKINDLNEELLRKFSELQKMSTSENAKIIDQLDKTRLELQQKEDRLDQLENNLNKTKLELDDKSAKLSDREKKVQELESIIAKQDSAVKALKDRIANALLGFADKGLNVEQRDGKIYVSMEAKLLFPSGSVVVSKDGQKAVKELSKALENQKDLEIIVEGHTDADALKSAVHPKDNWELSVLRSTAIVNIMLKHSSLDPKIISAAGKGEFVPVDVNDKAKNRRIEIVITPNLSELFKIISSN